MKLRARHRLGLAGMDATSPENSVSRERIVKIWKLPKDKDEQVAMTIAAMTAELVYASWHPKVRELANYAGLHARTKAELARAYTRFVRQCVQFRYDPRDVELVRRPSAMAEDILAGRPVAGDCDDMALLLATLLFVRGLTVAFVTISTSPKNQEFRHVFVAAKIGGKWETYDPSVSSPYQTYGLRHKWWPVPYNAAPT